MLRNGIDVTKEGLSVGAPSKKITDIRNSKIFDVISELQNWGIRVVLVDSWADSAQVEAVCGLPLGVINKSCPVDSIIVAVGHNEFRELTPETLREFVLVCRF